MIERGGRTQAMRRHACSEWRTGDAQTRSSVPGSLRGHTGRVLSLYVRSLLLEYTGECGTLLLFNVFYVHWMIIVHLTYHPFMLVPWLAFFLLRMGPMSPPWHLHRVYDIVGAGLCMAYMVYAGMVNGTLPALASVVVIGLLH